AEIVDGDEQHQPQQQRKTRAKRPFLDYRIDRPAAHRLDRVKEEMTAIEQRNWEQVDESEINRDHRHEFDQRSSAQSRLLARKLGYLERAAKFFYRSPARDDLSYRFDHHGNDVARMAERGADDFSWR